MSPTAASTVALLTARSPGAIAVIRIGGSLVPGFLEAHFGPRPKPGVPAYGVMLGREGQPVDDVLVVVDSATSAEIHCHGGVFGTQYIVSLATSFGFAQREPGDEDADADSPVERQAVADLSLARTDLAVDWLLAQFALWSEALKSHPPDRLLLSRDRTLSRLLRPARVAVVGPTNAGKSTLVNALCRHEVAITHALPNTTRDWLEAETDLGGVPVVLLDTPGHSDSQDEPDIMARRLADAEVGRCDAVIVLLDPADPPAARALLSRVTHPVTIAAWGKSDLGHPVPPDIALSISGREQAGLADLVRAIHLAIGVNLAGGPRPLLWREAHFERVMSPCALSEVFA